MNWADDQLADKVHAWLLQRPEPRAEVTAFDLSAAFELTPDRVFLVMKQLHGRGLAAVVPKRSPGDCSAWRPLPAGRVPGAAEQMWSAMRAMRSFTPTSLAQHAAVGLVPIAVADARKYCRALLAAGYLTVVRKATAKTEAQYRLSRRSGPSAPKMRRVSAIIDPNSGETIVLPEAGQ